MKTLVVFQKELLHYRKDYFVELAQQLEPDYKLKICTSDNQIGQINNVEIIEKKSIKIGKFEHYPNLLNYTRKADISIIMFDIQWFNLYQELLFNRHKTVLWGHGFGRRKIARWPRIMLMKFAKAVMLYEAKNVALIESLGIKANKLFYNGNTIKIANSAMNWQAHNKKNLLYVGRLQARKGVDQLLHLFASALEQLAPDTQLSIVGDGEERANLEALSAELGISERVIFVGACFDDDELKSHFDQALLYVCPGLVGLGVLHAFAYGVGAATFSHDLHGPEVFNIEHGKSGFIFQQPQQMIDLFIQASQQPETMQVIGRAAFDYYQQQRSIEKMASRTITAVDYCHRHAIKQ